MTGFCVGGSLATIAACWAALQSPTSDVRCITFGAPHVGNAAFVEAFRCGRMLLDDQSLHGSWNPLVLQPTTAASASATRVRGTSVLATCGRGAEAGRAGACRLHELMCMVTIMYVDCKET